MKSVSTPLGRLLATSAASFLLLGTSALAQCPNDDALEPNDVCAAASALGGPVMLSNLALVTGSTQDYYSITIPANTDMQVDLVFGGIVNIDLRVHSPDCSIVYGESISATPNETVTIGNVSTSPVACVIRVSKLAGGPTCSNYDMNVSFTSPSTDACVAFPEDNLEPNDTCPGAHVVTSPGIQGMNLVTYKFDEDWYRITVPPGATLEVECLFLHASGDIDLTIHRTNHGNPVAVSESADDNELAMTTNAQAVPVDYIARVHVWDGDPIDCNSYTLRMDFQGGVMNMTDACSGDGGNQLGCTDCPCGNNASNGTVGGCVNSAGTSARLLPSGSASVSAATLRFEVSGAPPQNSCQLTSGNALAPANAANPCFGLDSGIQSVSLDGLRCVVQGVLRHGVRPSDVNGDVGVTTNGWGDPNGFFNFAAFMSGDTKHFQVINRDDIMAVCGTGQNTSQAISVTFNP